ncbi:MAG: LysR family transcriptional regulator [Marinifilaceae bacterium]
MSYQLDLELRHLKYFLAVANELNFRKASEKLFISQPGLSRQIKQLEEILEARLFIRDKRQVQLTPAGEYLKSEMEFFLNHLERTKKHLKLINQGKKGEIRMGFVGSAMQTVIPELLVKMNEEFPGIEANLEEMTNRAQVNAIQNDQLDIGFVRLTRVPPGIKIKNIYKDTFSIVLPKDHELNEKNFKGVHQLANENFILFSSDYSPLYYDEIMSICEDQGFTPKISHNSIHAQTIFRLVENKLGIAIVPSSLQYGFALDVKFIEIKDIPQETYLSMIWKEENRNPTLTNIIELLEE